MRRLLGVCMLLAGLTTTGAGALELKVGAQGAGSIGFSYGSYIGDKAAMLAELGASSLSMLGSSSTLQLPGWSAGGFVEAEVTPNVTVRIEPSYTFFQTGADAFDASGAQFDRYGVRYSAISLPVLVRARLTVAGSGYTASFGVFGSSVLSPVVVTDRSATTTATAALPAAGAFAAGLIAGAGYEVRLGVGTLSVELRADVALVGPFTTASSLGATLSPIDVGIELGYGVTVWRSK